MNGLGKTASRTSSFIKPGAKSKSIFEALQKAHGTSIFEMLREAHGGNSIFEELRHSASLNSNGNKKKGSILQKDWKKKS